MKIIIPGEFTGLNKLININRQNIGWANRVKQEETERVAWFLKAKGLEKIERPSVWNFTWFCKNRRRDPDNINSATKFILDGFVMAGVIRNDGWKYVAELNARFKVDKQNPRVEIEVVLVA